ncbi:MAG TPA: STAS domain-containing protein [bacterium]|jgi:anti-anti-sigma factor|nr:STAS domain-containing protein [bacterium]HOB70702.1 STAS domain-containing protein [bacterium]HPY14539.1 STAS domain-containing protein [bacterium]HQB08312.1 STAS domain-containing protein [bacterium]HQI03803.1 STAS domain-containing protein [bacterium]
MINFNIDHNEQVSTLTVKGRIDNEGIQGFQEALSALLEKDSKTVVLNLDALEFINSSGIGKLLIFYKKSKNLGRETSIQGISDDIFTLFKAIRLDKLIDIKR